ncbi:FAD:protein FMN transferase [Demequina zhanjiangensis]|uniref:FAD:protein FMN transferase n=1 Tax=Demequina zhanjiangensis TaxID=3051659 RepID=A0ABT8G326_9MICO|nr:FAD:protein FMN transferase [Demequina sp. SYSU T00b26]MDN4473552.1 FAD:protein FMN transferase [Demequina sp. SYSU T00b26]
MIAAAHAMAMEFTLHVDDGVDRAALASTMSHVESDLRWADAVFSTFSETSWISRLSRGETTVADCPPAVEQVLDLCAHYKGATRGAFDALSPDGAIDPTGIVKTWAMERVRWRLDDLPAAGWLWGCAGDAVVSGIGPDEGRTWRVGIAHPEHRFQSVGAVTLGGEHTAIATSGTTVHGGHIWAPGGEAPAYVQASVVGTDLVECDAWATAIVAGGEPVALAAQEHGMDVLALRMVDGRIVAERSPGWDWAA